MSEHYLGTVVECEDGVREFAIDRESLEFIYRFWGNGVPDPNWMITDIAYVAEMGIDIKKKELPILSGCKIR